MTAIFRWEYERGGLYTKARHILIRACLEADGLNPDNEFLRHRSPSWYRAFEALPSPHDSRDMAIAQFWENNCHQKEFLRFGFTAQQLVRFFPFALRNALLRNGASLHILEATYFCQGETQVIYPTLRATRIKEIRWNPRSMTPSSKTSAKLSMTRIQRTQSVARSSATPSIESVPTESYIVLSPSRPMTEGPELQP